VLVSLNEDVAPKTRISRHSEVVVIAWSLALTAG
jgi:hypothetical protein